MSTTPDTWKAIPGFPALVPTGMPTVPPATIPPQIIETAAATATINQILPTATTDATATIDGGTIGTPSTPLSPTSTPGAGGSTPIPTSTLYPGPHVVISRVNKVAEYVDIWNAGDAAQNLSGWRLVSERGNQSCTIDGTLGPRESLRIFAQTGEGGYNCGYSENIWNNDDPDAAVLYDAQGVEVDRY